MFRNRQVKVHFVGIGGIGMSGIAEVLLNLGYRVSGSDLRESDTTRRLPALGGGSSSATAPRTSSRRRRGGDLLRGPQGQPGGRQPPEPQDPGDPARRDARRADATEVRRGHRRLPRQDDDHLHGGHLLAPRRPRSHRGGRRQAERPRLQRQAGQGRVDGGGGRRVGRLVPRLSPAIAVVTNIDPEHLDHYGPGRGAAAGLRRVRQPGALLRPGGDVPRSPGGAAVCPARGKRVVTYGVSPQADYRAEQVELRPLHRRFVASRRGMPLGEVQLQMVGDAQRSERARGGGGRRRDGHSLTEVRRAPWPIQRRTAALHGARRGQGRARWSTTTVTTPRRSGDAARAPARRSGGGWWSPSSRTATRAPATC